MSCSVLIPMDVPDAHGWGAQLAPWLPSSWLECDGTGPGYKALFCPPSPPPRKPLALMAPWRWLEVLHIILVHYDHYISFVSKLYVYIFLQVLIFVKHAKLQQMLYPWFLGGDFKIKYVCDNN